MRSGGGSRGVGGRGGVVSGGSRVVYAPGGVRYGPRWGGYYGGHYGHYGYGPYGPYIPAYYYYPVVATIRHN